MAYNQKLAERIRLQLDGTPVVEKKMFGGVGFLLNGNTPALASGAGVACGVDKDDLAVRVDPERHGTLLKKPHAKPFGLTGKPMNVGCLLKPQGAKQRSH